MLAKIVSICTPVASTAVATSTDKTPFDEFTVDVLNLQCVINGILVDIPNGDNCRAIVTHAGCIVNIGCYICV